MIWISIWEIRLSIWYSIVNLMYRSMKKALLDQPFWRYSSIPGKVEMYNSGTL